MGRITTGVDKLLRFLEEKGKVSSIEAVAHLGVDKDVLDEWVELLEHEKLVTVTYNFSKQYIELRDEDATPAVARNLKQVSSEQDAFRRKIDVAINEIDKETSGFEVLKHHYHQVQHNIRDELETVRTQMNELERFDKLRTHVEQDIEQQQKSFKKFTAYYDQQVKMYRENYKSFVAEIIIEEKKINLVKEKISGLKKQKEDTEKLIKDGIVTLKHISDELGTHLKEVSAAEKRVFTVSNKLDDLQKGADAKKEDFLKKLAKRIGQNNETIELEQEELLRSSKERVKLIQEYTVSGKNAYENFNKIFMKKIKTLDLFDDIEEEKIALIKDLESLKKKVDTFSILSKYAKAKKQTGDIENIIKKYTKRKTSLLHKIHTLVNFIDK